MDHTYPSNYSYTTPELVSSNIKTVYEKELDELKECVNKCAAIIAGVEWKKKRKCNLSFMVKVEHHK